MHLKCLFGGHQWYGCKCLRCGKFRDEGHNWRVDECIRCGATRQLCGKDRDEDHDWSKDCEICAICRKVRQDAHSWDSCQCSVCGKKRDVEHDWEGCICKKCGKNREEGHDWVGNKCSRCNKILEAVDKESRLTPVAASSVSPLLSSATTTSAKTPLVNIISLHIIAERTNDCQLPQSSNMILNAPDGLLSRAAREMNLGRHIEEFALSHSTITEIVPEFSSDSERSQYFRSLCSGTTWFAYFEFSGMGFRYNVIVDLDRKTFNAAIASKQHGMPIEMALVDLSDLKL